MQSQALDACFSAAGSFPVTRTASAFARTGSARLASCALRAPHQHRTLWPVRTFSVKATPRFRVSCSQGDDDDESQMPPEIERFCGDSPFMRNSMGFLMEHAARQEVGIIFARHEKLDRIKERQHVNLEKRAEVYKRMLDEEPIRKGGPMSQLQMNLAALATKPMEKRLHGMKRLVEDVMRQKAIKELGESGFESAEIWSISGILALFPTDLQGKLMARMMCDLEDTLLESLLFQQLASILVENKSTAFLGLIEQELGSEFKVQKKETDVRLGDLLRTWCLGPEAEDDAKLENMFSFMKAGKESEVGKRALDVVHAFKKFSRQGRESLDLLFYSGLAMSLINLRVYNKWMDRIEARFRGRVDVLPHKLHVEIGEISLFPDQPSDLEKVKKELHEYGLLFLWVSSLLQLDEIDIIGHIFVVVERSVDRSGAGPDLDTFNSHEELRKTFNGKEASGGLYYLVHKIVSRSIDADSKEDEEEEEEEDCF